MLSFPTDRRLAAALACIGVAAWTFPFVVPAYSLLLLAAVVTSTLCMKPMLAKSIWFLACFALAISSYAGVVAMPLAIACISSFALVLLSPQYAPIAITILVLQTNAILTSSGHLSQVLAQFGVGVAAPSLLALSIAWACLRYRAWQFFLLVAVTLAVAAIVHWVAILPAAALVITAVPAIICVGIGGLSPIHRGVLIPALMTGVVLATWGLTPPRESSSLWTLLPNNPDVYEAKFFKNYASVLSFSGIHVKVARSANEIPADATVLLPWLSAELPNSRNSNF